mmetsp:Transcript_21662/g.49324  ORF Transcript_21662/g.49324 Transcript_21662/m.49324 type:complete len:213 (-) Transcript_21662:11-649(-)
MIGRCVRFSRSQFTRWYRTTVPSTSQPLSPYEVLGVKHDAKSEELRAAYIELARRFHPDQARGDANLTTEEAAEQFKQVQSAWYVLGDETRRQEFDVHGTLAASPAKMSAAMWLKLKSASPQDGTIIPNWGTDEPPLWIIVTGPIAMFFLVSVFVLRNDIRNQIRERLLLWRGGWVCEDCLIVNEPSAGQCRLCNKARYTPFPALGNVRVQV